jgi:lysophospholipase L1-like esterase
MSIIVVGDSISYGVYDKQGGWAKRLFQDGSNEDNANAYVNLSRPGATSKKVLLKLKSAVKAGLLIKGCTKVVFAYGINDSAISLKDGCAVTTITEFEENTKKMISIINKHNVKMFFVGLTIVNEALAGNYNNKMNYTNERIQRYNDTLKRICYELDIGFIDLYNECINEKTLFVNMLYDGLHPDENGHYEILTTGSILYQV